MPNTEQVFEEFLRQFAKTTSEKTGSKIKFWETVAKSGEDLDSWLHIYVPSTRKRFDEKVHLNLEFHVEREEACKRLIYKILQDSLLNMSWESIGQLLKDKGLINTQ